MTVSHAAEVDDRPVSRRPGISIVETLKAEGRAHVRWNMELPGGLVEALTRVRDISADDGSLGWLVMLGGVNAWLHEIVTGETVGPHEFISCNAAPRGQLVATPDGTTLDGAWTMCSGVTDCDRLVVGAKGLDIGSGQQAVHLVSLDRAAFESAADWNGFGLDGTDSSTAVVTSHPVPTSELVRFFPSSAEWERRARHRPLSVQTALVVGAAAAAAGIFSTFEAELPEAVDETGVTGRWEHLLASVDEAYEAWRPTGTTNPRACADVRLASTALVRAARQAATDRFTGVGSSALDRDAPLCVALCDILVLSQHSLLSSRFEPWLQSIAAGGASDAQYV